jgi:hypothetical protein
MRIKTVGNLGDKVIVTAKNAESSATISRGRPVALVYNGTADGLGVVLPTTSSLLKVNAFRYGVAVKDIEAGQVGEVQVFGHCEFVVLTLQTRANTSGGSSFSTADTVALGQLLTILTAANAFSTIANTVAFASTDAFTLSNFNPSPAAIGQSLASAAGIATSTSETRTAVTQGVKAFLRFM